MSLEISSALASAFDTAATAACDDAFVSTVGTNAVLEIRTGSPAGVSNSAGGDLLASVTIASWTAGSPGAGQVTGSNPGAVTATDSGTAAHFRLKTSGGTAVMEGTVGESAADLVIDETDFVQGGSVDLGAPVFTVPVSAATS